MGETQRGTAGRNGVMMRPKTIRIIAAVTVAVLALTFIAGWDNALAQQVWGDWLVSCPLCCFG
jgi:hypothetical protein